MNEFYKDSKNGKLKSLQLNQGNVEIKYEYISNDTLPNELTCSFTYESQQYSYKFIKFDDNEKSFYKNEIYTMAKNMKIELLREAPIDLVSCLVSVLKVSH